MKPSVVLSALLLIAFFGCEEKEKVIETVDEVPKDVFNIALCETLHSTVMSMLSESHNNRDKHPQLFGSNLQGQIVLKQESDVYVSYVYESASMPSTLGFYAYNGNSPSTPDDVNREIAFPHVSSAVLTPGDSRRLGRFKAGTTLGFFLVVGGYSNNTVNWSKPTFWTRQEWNEASEQQHILFSEQQCNNIIMAFEDKNVATGADRDYNDIVFIISDNDKAQASTAFDLNSVPSM